MVEKADYLGRRKGRRKASPWTLLNGKF